MLMLVLIILEYHYEPVSSVLGTFVDNTGKPLRYHRNDSVVVFWYSKYLGDADGLIQTRSLFAHTFLPIWLHTITGYFPTPLDLVIITEFSYWLWNHIFASFPGKNKGIKSRNPMQLFFPEQLCTSYGGLYKQDYKHTKLGIGHFLS